MTSDHNRELLEGYTQTEESGTMTSFSECDGIQVDSNDETEVRAGHSSQNAIVIDPRSGQLLLKKTGLKITKGLIHEDSVPSADTEIYDDDSDTAAMIKELLDTRIRPSVLVCLKSFCQCVNNFIFVFKI